MSVTSLKPCDLPEPTRSPQSVLEMLQIFKACSSDASATRFSLCSLSACGLLGVSEVLTSRTASRCSLDAGGAKAKVSCPKEHWHRYV